jgi:hypothetical protein
MNSSLTTEVKMNRRHFAKHLAKSMLFGPYALNLIAGLENRINNNKSCITIWLGGGPSTIDMWDLKPESKNGGEFKPIQSSVPNLMISEHLPMTSLLMDKGTIIKSLNYQNGNHEQATYITHTGYSANPTIIHPSFGSVISYELSSSRNLPIPSNISINGNSIGAGFLGMGYSPFSVNNPGNSLDNIDFNLSKNKIKLWESLEGNFAKGRSRAATDHYKVYNKAIDMTYSPITSLFDFKSETVNIERYGNNNFGKGCLLARKLVEVGVPYVEVNLGGWDTHQKNFDSLKNNLLPTLDKGLSNLLKDLLSRGLLDDTIVVVMGEFVRTPKINPTAGRDHWVRGALAVFGGDLQGGKIIGETDKDGTDITKDEVKIGSVIDIVYRSLGIDPATEYETPNGRPHRIVDKSERVLV